MRPENILAWSIGVEPGAPPPSQPLFDEFGNPVVNVTANIKEWKREFQAQQAERKTQERVFRQQNMGTMKTGASNPDVEAYMKDWRRASIRQNSEREAYERVPRRQNLNTTKTGPSRSDAEALLNHMRKQGFESAERDRIARQRKILFPNTVPKEDVKPEPKTYKIPQRKPVPKSNDTTSRPPPPQVVLLRNGETKTLENRASYSKRVRELGYPEVLCPLPMREGSGERNVGVEVDCTGAKVVKRNDDRQICSRGQKLDTQGYSDGIETPQNPVLTPEMLSLAGEFRTLKPGQKRL